MHSNWFPVILNVCSGFEILRMAFFNNFNSCLSISFPSRPVASCGPVWGLVCWCDCNIPHRYNNVNSLFALFIVQQFNLFCNQYIVFPANAHNILWSYSVPPPGHLWGVPAYRGREGYVRIVRTQKKDSN